MLICIIYFIFCVDCAKFAFSHNKMFAISMPIMPTQDVTNWFKSIIDMMKKSCRFFSTQYYMA